MFERLMATGVDEFNHADDSTAGKLRLSTDRPPEIGFICKLILLYINVKLDLINFKHMEIFQ